MSKNRPTKLWMAPLLAFSLAVGACSDTGQGALLGPSEQPSQSLSLAADLRNMAAGITPDLSVRYHSAVIGPEGGNVYVDLHNLYVPRGAVTGPTKFEVRLRDDHRIGAGLTATSVRQTPEGWEETGPKNDVGSAGFKKAVYLTFSYRYASDAPRDPNMIRVVKVVDGRLVPQPTFVNRTWKTATGGLRSFSEYGLAWP